MLRKWVEQLRNWVDTVWPEIKEFFSNLVFALKGLFEVLFGSDGTVWSRWGDFKNEFQQYRFDQKTKKDMNIVENVGWGTDEHIEKLAIDTGMSLETMRDMIDVVSETVGIPTMIPSSEIRSEKNVSAIFNVDPTKNGSASITGDGDVSVAGGIRPAIGGVR